MTLRKEPGLCLRAACKQTGLLLSSGVWALRSPARSRLLPWPLTEIGEAQGAHQPGEAGTPGSARLPCAPPFPSRNWGTLVLMLC